MTADKNQDLSEPRVGVYICHCGGNISDHVDVEAVAEAAAGIPGVSVARTNMFMCSDPGQELIQKDIRDGVVNRIVVASCAPSLHELTFRNAIRRAGMNPYLYDHANIREQDSWVHHGPAATKKAETLIAAAVAKTRNLDPLDPIRVNAHNHATVIGGGIAGLRAALDLSRRGISVALVEKSPFLGGQAANLDTVYPTGEAARDLILGLARAVCKEPRIQVHTCSRLTGCDGYVGNFHLTLSSNPPSSAQDQARLAKLDGPVTVNGKYAPFAGYCPFTVPTEAHEISLDTGAIVIATGFRTYAPRQGEFGFGEDPGIITVHRLIESMATQPRDNPALNINGRTIRRVAIIHCVGSRQIPGIHEPDAQGKLNEHCSRTCCTTSLHTALQIRQRFPGTRVMEYYRDIRTYGRGHEEYYERAAQASVLFFRYEADSLPQIRRTLGGEYPLAVTVKDTLTFGEIVEAGVDLVALAVGMEAGPVQDLVDMMKLPVGADGFLQEVHPKLRPVELSTTGILLAGTCQAPMDMGETCNAAQAAAAKAATLLSKGYVELDPFVARVDALRCTGTGACVSVCPVKAVSLVETASGGQTPLRAEVNPALCTGCGICVPECPHNAIDVMGWSLKQYEEMVDAIVAA
ncbi:MAG: CoB--CoM heterodisulfide reductase iron-sulfur subunit A family protein [Pseudomonadota bacterium]